MAVAARKREHEPAPKMFHATMLVTRAEEWCVEAKSAEEARELLAHGHGHRCHLGDRLHAEVQQLAIEVGRQQTTCFAGWGIFLA